MTWLCWHKWKPVLRSYYGERYIGRKCVKCGALR